MSAADQHSGGAQVGRDVRRGAGTSAWFARLVTALGCGILALGCGEKDQRTKTRGVPGARPEPAANLKQVGQPSAEVVADREKRAQAEPEARPRRRPAEIALPKPDEFTERDFSESEQESRDPFRSFLMVEPQKTGPEIIAPGDVVYLQDFPLGELKVNGIVGAHPKFAMVADPRTGRTTILKARDRIAKERALIFQVNQDHLVLLIPRVKPGKDDPYERVNLYVDETRKIVDVGSEQLRPDEGGIRLAGPAGKPRRRTPATKEP